MSRSPRRRLRRTLTSARFHHLVKNSVPDSLLAAAQFHAVVGQKLNPGSLERDTNRVNRPIIGGPGLPFEIGDCLFCYARRFLKIGLRPVDERSPRATLGWCNCHKQGNVTLKGLTNRSQNITLLMSLTWQPSGELAPPDWA